MSQHHNKLRNLLRKNGIETPENKLIIDVLEAKFPNHGKLAEWLHREVRQERIICRVLNELEVVQGFINEEQRYVELVKEAEGRKELGYAEELQQNVKAWAEEAQGVSKRLEDPTYLATTRFGFRNEELTVDLLDALEEVLKKRKQRGEECRIMKFEANDLFDEARKIRFETIARDMGEVLYEFEDGWTIRRICTGAEMKLEGEMLGHCAGQYAERVNHGESHNYSLRDSKGFAHLTLEIKHTRPSIVDIDALRETLAYLDMDYQCPYCEYRVVDGRCQSCFFNLDDLVTWQGIRNDTDAVERLNRQMQDMFNELWRKQKAHDEHAQDNFDARCPNCSENQEYLRIREDVERPDGGPEVKCTWCGAVFWRYGNPFEPEHMDLSGMNRSGGHGPTWHPRAWERSVNALLRSYIVHDFREGNAYQIQGKQNVSPHAKYHPYVQEWMRSIPYDVRPRATWSAYYTKTDVLHVDDLELGGAEGEDDFGFRWDDRGYNWPSILYSLHGGPKRWAKNDSEHVKRFAEETSLTIEEHGYQYVPELGERAFAFAKEIGALPRLIEIFEEWKANRGTGGPDLTNNPYLGCECPSCHHTRYLQVAEGYGDDKVRCEYCGDLFSAKKFKKQVKQNVEEVTTDVGYIPYERAVLDHLGGLLEAEKKVKFKLESFTTVRAYKCIPKDPLKRPNENIIADKWAIDIDGQEIRYQMPRHENMINFYVDYDRDQWGNPGRIVGGRRNPNG